MGHELVAVVGVRVEVLKRGSTHRDGRVALEVDPGAVVLDRVDAVAVVVCDIHAGLGRVAVDGEEVAVAQGGARAACVGTQGGLPGLAGVHTGLLVIGPQTFTCMVSEPLTLMVYPSSLASGDRSHVWPSAVKVQSGAPATAPASIARYV